MVRRVIGLGADGKLTERLPSGEVRKFKQGSISNASVYLLLDCSGSMSGRKLDLARSGARDFCSRAIQDGYEVGIIRFASSANLVCAGLRDPSEIALRLASLTADGGTILTGAIQLAVAELAGFAGGRAIVIATDGDASDQEDAVEAAQAAKALGIQIITIGTEDADLDFLKALASTTELAIPVKTLEIGRGIAQAAALLSYRAGDTK